jgi:hypothetical protein
MQWIEGRGSASFEVVLDRLEFGQIAREPVLDQISDVYHLVKRLEPVPASPAPMTTFEMPSPSAPDLAYVLGQSMSRSVAATVLLDIGARASALAQAEPAIAAQLAQLHDLRNILDDNLPNSEALAQLDKLYGRVRELLGESGFKEYLAIVNGTLESVVLQWSTAGTPGPGATAGR